MITVEYIKSFGEYRGFCERTGAYIYYVGKKKYGWNGNGVLRLW